MKRNNARSSLKKSQPIHKVVPPPPTINSNKPSLGNTIKDGIASGISFGTGSAIAHRAMDSIFGNRKIEVENKPDNTCQILMENYRKCLEIKYTVNNCSEIENLMKIFKCSIDNHIN